MPQERRIMERINTDMAIHAFREVERVKFLLERKEHALRQALGRNIDRKRYVEETNEISAEFEGKLQGFTKSVGN